MDTIGDRLRKTASDVADRLGEAAHSANERIAEMRGIQRLNSRIRELKREKDRCKMTMADLLIRMFDQNTFAEVLLRPEYLRIRELDAELAELEEERRQVMARGTGPEEAGAPAEAEIAATSEPEAPVIPKTPADVEAPDETTPPMTPLGPEA